MDGLPEKVSLILLLSSYPFNEAGLFLKKGPIVIESVDSKGFLQTLIAAQLREIPRGVMRI